MNIEEMRKIREERGISLRQLSEYSGVPVVTLQKVFSGETRNPRRATLDAIEKILSSDSDLYQGKSYQYAFGAKTPEYKVCEPIMSYGTSLQKLSDSPRQTGKQREYTLEDYYKIPDERRVELIDGVIYDMSAPTTLHQDINSYIHMCIYQYLREKKKKCKVYESPVDVQLNCDDRTMLQPDVLVVCDRDKVQLKKIFGAPDFILEVLSAATRRKDMSIKLTKYMESGVREYWIIDPMRKVLIVHNFMEDDYIPAIFPLTQKVPLAISQGELMIDLVPVKESIEEFE